MGILSKMDKNHKMGKLRNLGFYKEFIIFYIMIYFLLLFIFINYKFFNMFI